MKILVALLFSFCTLQLCWGEIRTAGRVMRTINNGIFGRAILPIEDLCNSTENVGKSFCNGEPICDSDSVVTCLSNGTGFPVVCPPERPYCVNNVASGSPTCSVTPPEGCTASTPPFQCTGVGNYPDPSNCKVYYNCYKKENEIKAETLTCPPGYVFDPNSASKQFCLYTSTPSKCVTVTGCDGKMKNILLNYTNNAQFVALCIPSADQPLIFQCPTGTKANLDNIPVTCTFTCKSEGQFEYTPDKTYYYECRFDASKKLYSALKPCPEGHEFQKTVCVRL